MLGVVRRKNTPRPNTSYRNERSETHVEKTASQLENTDGEFITPRGPLNGPRGPFKGPRGPFKGPSAGTIWGTGCLKAVWRNFLGAAKLH